MKNPYLPFSMKIEKIVNETEDYNIKTFHLTFVDKEDETAFRYVPGQFAELSVFGKGEAPFGMASTPTEPGRLEFSVSRVGVVTDALHDRTEGDIIGVRGPLGNGYPLEAFKGKDIVLIGGGFGFSTLRALTNYMIHDGNRGRFGEITAIYGARRPGLLLYKEDLETWRKSGDLDLHLTVDSGEDDWKGRVGFVPTIVREVAPGPENALVVVCGPPAMIRITLPVLEELGFLPEGILLSLEMKMKCGVGMCGRCNVGSKYICRDGPVFNLAQISGLFPEGRAK